MKKLLLASVIMPLLLTQTPAFAEKMTVKVPVTVKSMREEMAFVNVGCGVKFIENNVHTTRPARSQVIPLDEFGNLQQVLSFDIETGGIPPNVLHGPNTHILCSAFFLGENKQSVVLSSIVPVDASARTMLIKDEVSNFEVIARQWVPDSPASLLNSMNRNNHAPISAPSNNLRIR